MYCIEVLYQHTLNSVTTVLSVRIKNNVHVSKILSTYTYDNFGYFDTNEELNGHLFRYHISRHNIGSYEIISVRIIKSLCD